MKTTSHKYQAISTEDDDGRPAASIIELTSGRPSADDYRSIADYQSAFSYSRQINLHALTEKRPLVGIEKLAHYFVTFFCAIFTFLLLPWSLIFALKRVRPNEQLVVYRLGRVQTPPRRSGLTFVLPIVDYTKRIRTNQNSLAISPIQILCQDNSIIEVHLCVEYDIDDPVLVSNSLNDMTTSLKSLARSTLVSLISKTDGMKIEQQIYTIELSLKNEFNHFVRKWGINIAKVNIVQTKIISTSEENQQNQASLHPALDVFTKIFAGIMQQQQQPPNAPITVKSTDNPASPVLQLVVQRLKPVLNEELVRQIKTTFQFNIATLGQFYIDLKNGNGTCDTGPSPLPSTDVTITLTNPEDLRLLSTNDSNELVQAYLSHRITIDGSLQDAMNLKYLADALRRDNIMLSNIIARYYLITDQLIRYTRFFFSSPSFAFIDLPSITTTSPQSYLPDTSILLAQKHRATIERRRVRRHSDLPMSLMMKYGTPRQDLHQCLECGKWHEKKTICGNCYDRIRKETQAMKDSYPNQDEFKYNYPQQEIVYTYKNDQKFSDDTKRIVEIPRERPGWFSKNLIPKINTIK